MTVPSAVSIPAAQHNTLRGRDYLLLALLGLLLFGYCTISGKPLTMHEARLPECSREMLAEGRWLFPHSGGRPWLERPPFPHWIELAVGHLTGRLDRVWIVRIPPALAGIATILLVGWMASRLFGRTIGLLSAAALATMYEFYFYAGQAEDDIFLATLTTACFALFVKAEFGAAGALTGGPPQAESNRYGLLGLRPWPVLAFFILLGLTNLAKGPLVGAIDVMSAIGLFVLLQRHRLRRWLWPWGWLIFLAVGLAWPLAAYHYFPSVWDNWMWDFHKGEFGAQPVWYYVVFILAAAAPWTPAAIAGFLATWKSARARHPNTLFVWCWAIAPLIILSIPSRKHHHYLLPVLPAWAMMTAFGVRQAYEWLLRQTPKPNTVRNSVMFIALPGLAALIWAGWFKKSLGPQPAAVVLCITWIACVTGISLGFARRNGRLIFTALLAGIVILCAWAQSVPAVKDENRFGDLAFIARVNKEVPPDKLLFIEARDSLDFFRFQFYSRPDARIAHNVTFLRDEKITAPDVYIVARAVRLHYLAQELGECEQVDQSIRTRKEASRDDRWTLFHITYKPGLQRYPAPPIDVLQAIYRGTGDREGPFCGPKANEDEPAVARR